MLLLQKGLIRIHIHLLKSRKGIRIHCTASRHTNKLEPCAIFMSFPKQEEQQDYLEISTFSGIIAVIRLVLTRSLIGW